MRNLRLTIAYDGTAYQGWQVQPNGPSIQAALESAIQKLAGEKVRLTVAGRTDSGVHALGQVANFPTESKIPLEKFIPGLQNFLPDDIVIRQVEEVPVEFHATYDTIRKRYRYLIYNHRLIDPFMRKCAWHFRGPLDSEAMHAAAQHLLGTHDFRCFESHYPNKATSIRTIQEAIVGRCSTWPAWCQTESLNSLPQEDGNFIWFDVVADGFLYNMVRAIMGTLVRVGRGMWEPKQVKQIIENQDRSQAGETAPPHGLYLVSVDY